MAGKKTVAKKTSKKVTKKTSKKVTKAAKRQTKKELHAQAKKLLEAGKDPRNGRFVKGNEIGPRWQKGVTPNPLGRPPHTRQLTRALQGMLEGKAKDYPMIKDLAKELGLPPMKSTVMDVVVANHIGHVLNGESAFMREMWNRIEGKVADKLAAQIHDKMSITDMVQLLDLGDSDGDGYDEDGSIDFNEEL